MEIEDDICTEEEGQATAATATASTVVTMDSADVLVDTDDEAPPRRRGQRLHRHHVEEEAQDEVEIIEVSPRRPQSIAFDRVHRLLHGSARRRPLLLRWRHLLQTVVARRS